MRDLIAGERTTITSAGITLALVPALHPPLAMALVSLDTARRGCRENPPIDTVARELRPGLRFDDGQAVVRFPDLPVTTDRVALVLFSTIGAGGGAALRNTGPIVVVADQLRFAVDLTDRGDSALILIELYRHGGGWKLVANGQGFAGGLAAVAAAFGLDPDWARRLEGRAESHAPDDRIPPRSGTSTGSGVAVGPHHILSNAHVVDEAGRITITGSGRPIDADLVFCDSHNDLALLRVDPVLPAVVTFRPGLDLHLGEDIVVLGFPLQGLLGSGPQASAGNIAALCGIRNDSTVFQFTAPIASGNSGGPILDPLGHLVGLVSSSLNLDHVRRSGANAENVNFGIKGAVIRSFLDAFGLDALLAGDAIPLPRAAMVRSARDTIYRITCTC